jgi:hypothetical protein
VTNWFFNERKRVAHGTGWKPPLILRLQVNTAHSDDQDATEAGAVALVQIDETLTPPPNLSHSNGHNCNLTLPSLTGVCGGGLSGGSERYHKCENCSECGPNGDSGRAQVFAAWDGAYDYSHGTCSGSLNQKNSQGSTSCNTCNVCVFNIDGGICEDIQDNSVLYCNSCWQGTCSACENEQLAACHHDTSPDVSAWHNMFAEMPAY